MYFYGQLLLIVTLIYEIKCACVVGEHNLNV